MDKKQVYCRYCGRLIDEDAPFCTYCGKPQGEVGQGIIGIKRKSKQYMEFLVSVVLSVLGLLCLPLKKLVNIRFSEVQKDKFRRAKKLFLRYSIIIIAICAVIGGGIARYSYYYDKYLPNALDYYNRHLELGLTSSGEIEEFIKAHGLQNMSMAEQDQYYRDYQFERYFNGFNNYKQLRGLDRHKRNKLLEEAVLNKTLESFYKGKASDDDFIRISQLTPEGKRELIKSDYDPSDKYYFNNPVGTIALGASMGAGIGAMFGGVGAVPGAVLGAKIGGYLSIADAAISSAYNNNTESKLNDIVAKDNDRKKEKAQEIVPQISSLLESVTNGDIFKDANAMQQAAPVLQELKAYGVDVSKGEASNIDTLFKKVVAKNNSYYDTFKDRHELSDFTNGDKMNMVAQTLATDLTFNDGGYSSMAINNQDLQNHISKNQSAGDWGFNTLKNVVVGAAGAAVTAWTGAGMLGGAVTGAGYGLLASIGGALVHHLVDNNIDSKLNDIVANDNDRKKAQEIVPQVSSLLESVTNGDVFRNINTMQQAAPISQELKAYGVDVSKGEKLNVQYTGSGTEKAALFCSILTDLAKAQDYKKQNR